MTDKTDRELMQQALNDLEALVAYTKGGEPDLFMQVPSIEALRERLAKPDPRNQCGETCERAKLCAVCLAEMGAQPEQKPVAWLSTDSIGERYLWFSKPLDNNKAQPLYTVTPQREWQGLTKEEMQKLAETNLVYQPESYEWSGVFDLLRAVSEKLKEKNT